MPEVTFVLNGKKTTVSYEPGMHFLEVLRDQCSITSPKDGCAPQGYCGCCAVLVDGRPVLACLRKPEQMEGRDVVTLEGLPEKARQVLAQAFIQEGAIQCGYCIPGILIRAWSLIEQGRTENRDEVAGALSGHLCRCAGYSRILDAIQTAGEAWNNGGNFRGAQAPLSQFFWRRVRTEACASFRPRSRRPRRGPAFPWARCQQNHIARIARTPRASSAESQD